MTGIPGNKNTVLPKNLFNSIIRKHSHEVNQDKQGLMCSVIIPTLTLSQDVAEILNLLLREKELIKEIIIIIDAPEVNIEDIPDHFKVEPVRIFNTGKRMGSAAARNVGLDAALGDVILFLDSDCRPGEGIVRSHLERYSDCDIVAIGGIIDFVGNSSIQSRLVKNCSLLDSFSQAERYETLWWNPTANFSVRRKALGDIRFDSDFPKRGGGEDVFFGMQLKQKGRIAAEPKAVIKHPVWPGWLNTLRRFFRWGWAESILTGKAAGSSDSVVITVRRELSHVSMVFLSIIFSILLFLIFGYKTIWFIPLGVFFGWEIPTIFSPKRKKPILDEIADHFFQFVFDLGSTLGRMVPKRWSAINARAVFFQDHIYTLWEKTQLCERGGFLGGFIVFLLSIKLG
jgi:glycosyltransferase involved in cell wall biosynthesis